MKIFGNRLYTGYFLVTLIFVFLLLISGYFQIGFLSDDYVNIYSANVSSILEKFTSNMVHQNHLLLRPLWFLSFSLDLFLNKISSSSINILIISRIHNLFLYLMFAFLVSYMFNFKARDKSFSLLIYILILVFPNNIHSLLWVVCRLESQLGIFVFLSLFTFLLYKEKGEFLFLILSALSFFVSLLLKETAIMVPFLIYIANYFFFQEKREYGIKDYIPHLTILFLYIIYKLLILNISTNEILNYYSFGMPDRIAVIPKAFFSLLSSTDIMSFAYNMYIGNLINLLYLFIALILFLSVIIITYRRRLVSYILLLVLFLVLIAPNIIVGYFRPQLIIVPFSILVFFIMYDVSLLNNKSRLFIKYILVVLVLIFSVGSYSRLREYKYSYNKIKSTINLISDNLNGYNYKPVVLFLPSRLKQTYILDNLQATYNYFKYKDFVINDTIQGFVNYAALDLGSLNSEITIQRLNDFTIVATCTGETQFFYNIDNNSITDYENEYIKCEFQKEYMFFNKCKKVKLILKDLSKYSYIALTNNKLINLNPL